MHETAAGCLGNHRDLVPALRHASPDLCRIVLDTNVLLALWIFADPTVAPLRAALESGELKPVRSAATDAELAEVLARTELFAVPEARQAALLQGWVSQAEFVDAVVGAPWRCRDPLDQKFVDLAVTGGCRWLITRDKALLKLNRKSKATGLSITTPAGYAAALIPPAPAIPTASPFPQ